MAEEEDLSPEELDDLNRREIYIIDQRGIVVKAKKEGREEGRVEGEAASARNIASAMLQEGIEPAIVARTKDMMQSKFFDKM